MGTIPVLVHRPPPVISHYYARSSLPKISNGVSLPVYEWPEHEATNHSSSLVRKLRMRGVQLKANSHIPCGVALIHTHMPCCTSAMLRHCRVLRESPLPPFSQVVSTDSCEEHVTIACGLYRFSEEEEFHTLFGRLKCVKCFKMGISEFENFRVVAHS